MNFLKGGVDGKVETMIDEAANAAKQKMGDLIGGNAKQQEQKKKQQEGGVVGKLTDAVNKAAQDAATDKATETALNFGKKLFQ